MIPRAQAAVAAVHQAFGVEGLRAVGLLFQALGERSVVTVPGGGQNRVDGWQIQQAAEDLAGGVMEAMPLAELVARSFALLADEHRAMADQIRMFRAREVERAEHPCAGRSALERDVFDRIASGHAAMLGTGDPIRRAIRSLVRAGLLHAVADGLAVPPAKLALWRDHCAARGNGHG